MSEADRLIREWQKACANRYRTLGGEVAYDAARAALDAYVPEAEAPPAPAPTQEKSGGRCAHSHAGWCAICGCESPRCAPAPPREEDEMKDMIRIEIERAMSKVRGRIYTARTRERRVGNRVTLSYADGYDDGTDAALHAMNIVMRRIRRRARARGRG